MDLLRDILLILHFVGLASLLGGFLLQMKPRIKVVNNAMFHGVLTQLVTGLALFGLMEMGDGDVNHGRAAVKIAITVIIAVIVIARRKRESVTVPVWAAIGALTLANIVVAVVWS